MKDWMKIGLGAVIVSRLMGGKSRYGNPQMPCPRATGDVELNTENRQNAIDDYMYGPPNPAKPSEYYWMSLLINVWKIPKKVLSNERKRQELLQDIKSMRCGNCVAFDISPRMEVCMPGPISSVIPKPKKPNSNQTDETWDDRGANKLGYCWMFNFKCHSARTCKSWAAGGPITKDSVSYEWQKRAMRV